MELNNQWGHRTAMVDSSSTKTSLLHALATCHSLKQVHGEIIGDPLDIKMFHFTGWVCLEA
jgi:cation-transporting ATPase 13A3/4/5